jgi:hypothetical protein
MSIKRLGSMFVALIILTCAGAAQDQPQGQSGKVIEHVPVKAPSAASGAEMSATAPMVEGTARRPVH